MMGFAVEKGLHLVGQFVIEDYPDPGGSLPIFSDSSLVKGPRDKAILTPK